MCIVVLVCRSPQPVSEQRYNMELEAAEGTTKYLMFDFIYMHLVVGREAHQKPINK